MAGRNKLLDKGEENSAVIMNVVRRAEWYKQAGQNPDYDLQSDIEKRGGENILDTSVVSQTEPTLIEKASGRGGWDRGRVTLTLTLTLIGGGWDRGRVVPWGDFIPAELKDTSLLGYVFKMDTKGYYLDALHYALSPYLICI